MKFKTHVYAALTLAVVLTLVTLPAVVHALPFGKSSAVTELTPATFGSFVNSHKPTIILFYAPWCGHCKQLHPEYEKLAEAVKGTIRVGAINADEHSSIGQQYDVRGFPTLKYWKMGKKDINSPEEYRGPRSAASIQSTMMRDVTADKVKVLSSAADLREAVIQSPRQKLGVLFSTKDKVSPMLSVMAHSQKLQELPLYMVKDEAGAQAAFNVQSFPTIAVLHYSPTTTGEEGSVSMTPYTGKVAYEPLAKFFLQHLEGAEVGEDGSGADATGADTVAAPQQQRRRAALPVAPEVFRENTLSNYCSPDAQRLRSQAALCVVVWSRSLDLAAVHRHFQNEPLLFFDASDSIGQVTEQLGSDYGLSLSNSAESTVVLLRHSKVGELRYKELHPSSDDELVDALQRVLSGDLRLHMRRLS